MKTNTEDAPTEQEPFPEPFPFCEKPMRGLMWNGLIAALTAKSPAFARNQIAAQCLTALLSNSSYAPQRQTGSEEPLDAAYARRAVDYADALISELENRKGKDAQ